MSIRYPHLLSPVQVGNVLFKNRMEATAATPHFIQGTEPYPTEKWITMMANRARNGAAGVYINHLRNFIKAAQYEIVAVRYKGYKLINQKS